MKKWWFVVAAVVTLALVVVPRAVRYRRANLEELELNDNVRRTAQGSFIRLPLGNLHYELGGPDGAPLVVLVSDFATPYAIWDPVFDGLRSAGFRVLRYDHFGSGFSDRPEGRYDPEFYDQQILDLLDTLKVQDKVDLAGQGMGGTVAAAFLNRHPARARRLAMMDPEYRTGYEVPIRLRLPLSRAYSMVLRVSHMVESESDDFIRPEAFRRYLDGYREQMRYYGFRQATLSTMLNYWTQDATAEYRQLGKTGRPVLLFWGVADASSGIALSGKVREAIPQAEFHPVENAGHFPGLERPEIVNPILIDFLRRP